MTNQAATQGANSSQSKITEKDAGKSVKIVHKKLSTKKTCVKLRTATGKCVAKKTQDKSPKLPSSSPSHKGSSVPLEVAKSCSSKLLPDSTKSKNSTLKKSTEVGKKIALKKSRITKTKTQRNEKGNGKMIKQPSSNTFVDMWAVATSGKREASLNATMKVNIMFEKYSPSKSPKTPPKKAETVDSKQDENAQDTIVSEKGKPVEEISTAKPKKKKPSDSVQELCAFTVKDCDISTEKSKLPGKLGKKTINKSKPCDISSRKRKSPGYKIFKEESLAKIRKIEKKSPIKVKKKIVKKRRKVLPAGHQLCNIIEKCPRQASLVARAMIALDQEEDKVHDLTARTKVYDWMEQRSRPRAESRKIQWRNGLGRKVKDNDGQHSTKDEDTSACEVDSQSDTQAAPVESESLHNALLRTLHHIGDSRLLTEYFRAQKEDFQGFVEVEKCTTPEKQRQLSPDPKKTVSPAPAEEERDKEIEKPANFSSAKLQAGRVATPIPQFPVVQRASNISSSYRHHTLPQPIYPQPHTQPIKMTPYAPSPTYIYQYAMDRPQGGIYTTPSPTSIPYGVANTEVTPRDYASTLTLNHMDSLNMNRRGLNHFQPETYNTSLHLPMQQIGFNYGAYYPASIQSLPQQNVPTIPLHQQYPLIQTPVMTQHPIPSDVSQLETYQHEYSPYPILSNLGQETVCMPPPLNPVRRPTPLATPPAALRQAAVSHQPVPPSIDTRMSVNPVVHHVPRSPALDFPPNFVHRQNHHHDQFLTFPSCRPHPQSNRDQSSSPPFKYSMTGHGRNKSFSPCKKERDDSSLYNCDAVNKSSVCNNECMPKPLGSIRTNSESSDISDLLHSAHSTMYQIDGMNSMENIREFHQAPTSVSDPTVRDTSPSKINILGHTSFNASYSVSSILDKRNCKVKLEPEPKMCSVSQLSNVWSGVYQNVVGHPQSAFVCFASAGSVGGSGSKEASNRPPSSNMHTKSNIHVHHNSSSSSNQSVKREGNPEKIKTPGVIVIEDTDDSSDDEPLARLVKAKSMELPGGRASEAQNTDSNKTTNISKLKSSTLHIPKHQSKIRTKQMEQISDQIKPVDLVKVEKFTSVTLQSTGTTKHAQPQSTGTAKLVQPQSTGTAKSVHSQSTMTANHVESQSTGTAKHIEPQNTGTAKSVHSQSTGTAKRVESPSTETAKDLELQCTEDVKHVELQSTATVKQYVEPQNIGTSKHIEPQSIVTAKHVEPQSIGTAKRVEPQSTGTVKHVEPHSIQTIKRVEPQNTGTAKRVESQSTGAAKRVEPQNTGTAKRVESQSTGATKRVALKSQDGNTFTESHAKPQLEEKTNESLCRPQNSVRDKIHSDKETKQKSVPKKTAISNSSKTKKSAKKVKVAQPVWPLTPTKVNTNHGWSWASDGQMRLIPKITQSREEQVRIRKCYQSMRHTSGETVSIRDCVILQSDGDGSIPFVGKVSALWESLSGEMMFSMLWYYQPEHTATGREPDDGEQELFASKHREENSVACIDDKCFVLMYNAYCRLEAEGARHEQMVPVPKWRELIPEVTEEDKKYCRLPPPANACADNIWFCRYDYDIRKKVVKKPKHKKSNLRYRAPCKPV